MSKPQMKNDAKKNKNKKAALRPLINAILDVFKNKARPTLIPRPEEKKVKHTAAPPKSIRFETIEPRVLMSADTAIVINGAIDTPGEIDQYGFTLASDVKVVFDSLTNNSNLNWSLSGPDGAIVNGRNFVSSDSASMGGSPAIGLTAGDYTITVDGNRDATGAYGFRLLDLQTATEITPGTAVSGQLSPASETDAYKFNVTAGERFYFDMRSVSSGTTYWRLLDPNGQLVFGPSYMNGGDVDVQTLDLTGNYTLLIEGYYASTGTANYTFNVQKVTDDVAPLDLGTSASGTISHAGQVDRYTFTLENASRLYFDALTNISNFTWSLVGPRGTVISNRNFASSDSSNLGGGTLLDLVAGNYSLYVDAAGDATGAYVFRLTDVQGATELTPGTAVSGQLNPANETDLYKFNVTAGERFYFDMRNVSGGATYWRLLDPYGQLVFGPNYMNGGDVDVLGLAYSGTYTLLIEGAISATGATNYAFNVQKVEDDATAALVTGATANGSILTPGQLDRYSFTLENATQLYFDSLTNNSNFTWTLIGPRGTGVSGRNFSASDSGNLGGSPLLDLVAGSYTLLVDASADATGAYSFRLLDMQAATAIVPGATVSGQLAPGKETDIYRFDANYGDQFFFDQLSYSGGSTYWRLLDPYCRLVFGPNSFNDVGIQTLNFAGTYTLLIEGMVSDGNAAVNYNFKVDPRGNVPVTPLPLGTAMTLNTTVSGTLSAAGERGNYTFTLANAAQLYIDALVTDSSFQWTLAGPRGTVVSARQLYTSDSAWQAGSPLFDLMAGDYVLTIHGSGTGAYGFRLMDKTTATAIVPGTAVSGMLNPANETDAYKFNVTAGERYFFDVQSLSNTSYWRLLDPYGQLVFGPNYMGDIDVLTLGYSGSYTLLVEGPYYLTGSSSYAFNVQKVVDDLATMSIGTIVNGAIAHAGQQDRYTFTLDNAAQLYMDAMVNINSTNFSWSLIGPRGAVVSTRQLYASDSAYLAGSSLFDLVAGDYTLIVDGSGDLTGSYAFRLLDKSAATAIVPGTAVSGVLNPANETDAYKFNVTAGERFYFDVKSLSNTAYWRLLDPNGQLVSGPNYMSDIETFTLAQSGSYTLLVEGLYYLTGSTSYTFNVQKVVDDLATLSIGTTVNGSIAHAGQQDRYTFTVDNPARLYMDAMVNSTNFTWSLIGPRGAVVSTRQLYVSDSAWLSGSPLFDLVAGDYTLIVDGVSDLTGSYAFRLLDKSAAAAIVPGAAVSGLLNPGNETDAYKFNVTTGERYYFDVQSVSNTIYWRLLDPYGQLVFGPNGVGDVDVFTLGQSGSYTLLLEGPFYLTGSISYTFNLQKVADDLATLSIGTTVNGSIAHAGQQDRYTFTLDNAAQLYMDAMVNSSNFTWSLIGPRGAVVSTRRLYTSDSAWLGGSPLFDLVAGDYTLIVDSVSDLTGSYAFRLLDKSAATAIVPGTAVSGVLNPGQETDAYKFDATAGERFYFDVQSVGNTIYWRLLDPYGQLVFGPGGMGDIDVLTLGQSGSYTLLVEGPYYTTASISYSFNLQKVADDDATLSIGTTVNGSIAHAGQQDRYTFTLADASQLYFDALTNNSGLNWSLIGLRGAVISGRSFGSSDSASLGGSPMLDLLAGDYTLIIDGSGDTSGPYPKFNTPPRQNHRFGQAQKP